MYALHEDPLSVMQDRLALLLDRLIQLKARVTSKPGHPESLYILYGEFARLAETRLAQNTLSHLKLY